MLKLTAREKGALFFEGIITVILLVLINLALIIIIQNVIQTNQGVASGIFIIKQSLKIGPLQTQIWSYQRIVIVIFIVIDIFVVWWRLLRRYHQYQINHIIKVFKTIRSMHQ